MMGQDKMGSGRMDRLIKATNNAKMKIMQIQRRDNTHDAEKYWASRKFKLFRNLQVFSISVLLLLLLLFVSVLQYMLWAIAKATD